MPRKVMSGVVVSNKMDKTVVVQVQSAKRHALYNKVVRTVKKYMAHDEENTCHEGDIVQIEESRPMSHNKRWRVTEIVRRGSAE
jgi:small subunit ribosomal protein S17